MTAARTVTYCARCGALEAMHEIRADGTRGRRLGTPDGCPGYQPGRIEERPPEDELRRRLDAVLALHREDADPYGEPACGVCVDRGTGEWEPWPCPTVRAARGET